jgi:hypothetical protein
MRRAIWSTTFAAILLTVTAVYVATGHPRRIYDRLRKLNQEVSR